MPGSVPHSGDGRMSRLFSPVQGSLQSTRGDK